MLVLCVVVMLGRAGGRVAHPSILCVMYCSTGTCVGLLDGWDNTLDTQVVPHVARARPSYKSHTSLTIYRPLQLLLASIKLISPNTNRVIG